MPSLNDVYSQLQAINTNLGQLHGDNGTLIQGQIGVQQAVEAGTAATNAVNASVEQAVAALATLASGQQLTNALLHHLSLQTDTMICALEAISRNTCAIHNEAHHQTGLQIDLRRALDALRDFAETVHPDAALDYARRERLRQAQEDCCPPPPPQDVCQYQPCPAPPPFDGNGNGIA